MCRVLNDCLAFYMISAILLVRSFKAGQAELTEVVTNVNKLSDVTENRSETDLHPDISLQVQWNKQNISDFLNETIRNINITEMDYCYLLFGSDPGKDLFLFI